jgi:hypothetical protein
MNSSNVSFVLKAKGKKIVVRESSDIPYDFIEMKAKKEE